MSGAIRGASVQRTAQQREHAKADERPDHVHVAVREVQQLQDPVDHRVAQRDQGIDAAQDDPVHAQLEEEGPALGGREVDRVEHPGDERDREAAEIPEPLSKIIVHAGA